MDLSHIKSYEQLADYLRGFVNSQGGITPYDSGGIAHLLGALLENMHRHGIEADFGEIQERLTTEQAATLRRIAVHLQT
jgi:hypothetical protein